jgi:hypothetical protein
MLTGALVGYAVASVLSDNKSAADTYEAKETSYSGGGSTVSIDDSSSSDSYSSSDSGSSSSDSGSSSSGE